jgi:hypothetical protein
LVKAVQELDFLVDSLKSTIDSLMAPKEKSLLNDDADNSVPEEIQEVKLSLPDAATISDARPNPNDGITQISYYLPESVQNAKMVFYDDMGRTIKEVKLNEKGNGSVLVNSEKLNGGIYSYSIIVDDKVVDSKKMQRIK